MTDYTTDCEYCGEKFKDCPYKGSVKLHIDHAKRMGDWPDWYEVVETKRIPPSSH